MTEQEMRRDLFNKKQYVYLSKENSALYDEALAVRDMNGDEWAAVAIDLLLQIAEASRRAHIMCGR